MERGMMETDHGRRMHRTLNASGQKGKLSQVSEADGRGNRMGISKGKLGISKGIIKNDLA